jgi:hypothetical protein
MSADAWSVCPRCKARAEIGPRGNEFREDWKIGLIEDETPPQIIVKYRGECQRCCLFVEIHERFPIPDWQIGVPVTPPVEPNRPTGFVVRKTWSTVPAGWFVCVPGKTASWWEVIATRYAEGWQHVTLRGQDGREGTWPRDPDGEVKVRRGTQVPAEITDAIEALGEGAAIIEDRW